jgi:ectoine hydroxylase-related dioxygenase (phytanoyl-CoA dioxygenase family)
MESQLIIENIIQDEGYITVNDFYSESEISILYSELEQFGVFNFEMLIPEFEMLNSVSIVKELAYSDKIFSIVKSIIGENAFATNSFVLDKTLDNNWELNWHQDLKIAVKDKIETEGYYNWYFTSGIHYVVAPNEVEEKRLFVRIHFDDCDSQNGGLQNIPKSHKYGVVSDREIFKIITKQQSSSCNVKRGGVMLMKNLLFHRSPLSISNKHRRMLQINYSAAPLQNGLEYY